MKTKLFATAIALIISANMLAVNTQETVGCVTDTRTLTTPLDLIITDTENALTGSIDFANENAAVIFANINPSTVISKYLSKITINGEPATANTNCRVAIYRHGSIILPHGRSFQALTVYTEKDFQGESRSFAPGGRQVLTNKWNNCIQSIKLKRGYMATLANHEDGTGYSHCYIADQEDIEINLRPEQAGRTTMLRVFKWNWPSKKGSCDAREEWMMNECKSTWYYDWGAGRTQRTNHEYVPQRHHEAGESNGQGWKGAWESWANINASDETCTHVLGQNEPDNTSGAGEVYTYPVTIPSNPREKCSSYTLASVAKDFLYSGKRIGTFACCNPNTGWVKEYVDYCRENNIRIDFVATHYYIGGQSPQGCIDRLWSLHNVTGLPVWATEWNNGANWSGESGFSTDAGWYQWGSGNDNAKNGEWLRDVLKRADLPQNRNWLERLAVYNAVEGRREVFTNGRITDGGKIWGAYESDFAYNSQTGSINYFMPWTHHNPKDLEIIYDNKKGIATLTWTNPDTDITDFAVIEQKEGTKWVPIDTIPLNDSETLTTTIDVSSYTPGLHEMRITNNDYDGKKRQSNISSFTISSSHAIGRLQYGQIKIGDNEVVTTDIEPQEIAPYVVMGMVSFKNNGNALTNQITGLNKSNFKFRLNPWTLETPVEMKNAETIDYLVLPADTVIHIGDDFMLISQKFGYVKGDELEVVFPEAFPEGIIPIVVAQQNYNSTTTAPTTVKFYDITNTGFKVKLVRQEGITTNLQQQNVNYFAATPGQVSIGGGKMLTVGRNNETKVGGRLNIAVNLMNAAGEAISLANPYIVAAPQTNNYAMASVFRLQSTSTDENGVNAIKVRRQVDSSSTVTEGNNAENNGDYVGWFIISDDPNGSIDDSPVIDDPATGIVTTKSELGFTVSSADGMIIAEGKNMKAFNANGQQVAFGKKIPAGIYVVTNGKQSAKVVVR